MIFKISRSLVVYWYLIWPKIKMFEYKIGKFFFMLALDPHSNDFNDKNIREYTDRVFKVIRPTHIFSSHGI